MWMIKVVQMGGRNEIGRIERDVPWTLAIEMVKMSRTFLTWDIGPVKLNVSPSSA